MKTRQCCFNMLTELVNVLPGALTQHIPVLIPGDATSELPRFSSIVGGGGDGVLKYD